MLKNTKDRFFKQGRYENYQSNRLYLTSKSREKKSKIDKENVEIIQVPIIKEVKIVQERKIYDNDDTLERNMIAENMVKVGLLVMENKRLQLEYNTQLKILKELREIRIKNSRKI